MKSKICLFLVSMNCLNSSYSADLNNGNCTTPLPQVLAGNMIPKEISSIINAVEIENQRQVERIELDLLKKLAEQKSGMILHSNDTFADDGAQKNLNNRFSIDAWVKIARDLDRYHVDWSSTFIHEWDSTFNPPRRKKVPLDEGHWRKLLQNGLKLNIYEPSISQLNVVELDSSSRKTLRKAVGFVKGKLESESSELGRKWVSLLQSRKQNTPTTLFINNDNFSSQDMTNIMKTGAKIELRLNKNMRFNDYDKIMVLLKKVRDSGVADKFSVRYNGKNLEDFLLESKEGQSRLRDLLKSEQAK